MNNLFRNMFRIESTRLKSWDYSSKGNYFVTICTKDRNCFLGHIDGAKMFLSDIGTIAERYWQEIPCHFPFVKLDEHVVMPNHIHGIIAINKNEIVGTPIVETQNIASLRGNQNQNRFGPQSKNLASIIRGFKVGVKKWSTENDVSFEWQSRFYDRIIRSERELFNVRNYILNNPSNWKEDEEFVSRQNIEL